MTELSKRARVEGIFALIFLALGLAWPYFLALYGWYSLVHVQHMPTAKELADLLSYKAYAGCFGVPAVILGILGWRSVCGKIGLIGGALLFVNAVLQIVMWNSMWNR
jgi:hypothetical protein